MPKKQAFEEALKRLEEIVEKLETGDVSLDESLAVFQEGIDLYRFCHKRLTEAEKRVKVLIENVKGEFSLENFEPEGQGEAGADEEKS